MGRSTCQRKLGKLKALGLLEVTRHQRDDGSWGANHYRLIAPHAPNRGGVAHPGEAGSPAQVGQPVQEPSENHQELLLQAEVVQPPKFRPAEVSGTKVTAHEAQLATAVLKAFNTEAGTTFRSHIHLGKIVRRIREQPALSLDEHVDVIRRNMQNPWWKDDPSPAVLYGSEAAFERAMSRGKGKHAKQDYSEYN